MTGRAIRILMDFRVHVGGAHRYGRTLIQAVQDIAASQALDVTVHTKGSPFTPWGRRSVSRAASAVGADLVHGLHWEAPPTSRPVVISVHDVIPLDYRPSMPSTSRRMLYRRFLMSSIDRAARVIVPSPATADRLRASGVADDKLKVIPIGIDPLFKPLSPAAVSEARARFAGGRRYLATVVTPKPHKNMAALVTAVRSAGERIPVVATGDPIPGADPLAFAGRLDDQALRAFYGGADAFVLPSLIEGFGLPLAEAMACGTPGICGPGVAALAYVREGAVVVDVTRPEEMAEAMTSMLEDDPLRERTRAAGLRAVTRLSPDEMAMETVGTYRGALDQVGSSS